MILITIFLLIIAISFSDSQFKLNSIYFSRIAAVSTFFASVLCLNALFLEASASSQLGKGLSIYCGLFQVSYSNLLIENFIYIIGILIILSSSHISTYSVTTKKYIGSTGTDDYNDSSLHPSPFTLHPNGLHSGHSQALPICAAPSFQSQSHRVRGVVPSPYVMPSQSHKGLGVAANKWDLEGEVRSTSQFSQGIEKRPNLKEINLSQETKYYSLIGLFSMLGSSLLLSSCDLLSMYLSIELQSFSLYILATLYRNYSSTSAGLKYFLLGGLSSCIILLGSALIYAFTGLTGFDSLYSLMSSMNIISFDSLPLNNIILSYIQEQSQVSNIISNNTFYSNDDINLTNSTNSIINEFIKNMISLTKDFQLGLSLGLILVFSGLLFKISAAPFHNWSLGLLF
jgi:hypothetical protein